MRIKYVLSWKQRCYLLDKIIDEAAKGHLNTFSLVWMLRAHCLPLMGCEFTQDPRPQDEQQKMDEFGAHCKNIAALGLWLKLLRPEETRIYQERPLAPFTRTDIAMTRFGRLYRRCSPFLKMTIMTMGQFLRRSIQAVQKYRWVSAFASFGLLATKVWQSGAIDKTWIAISAVVGIAVAWLFSFWR